MSLLARPTPDIDAAVEPASTPSREPAERRIGWFVVGALGVLVLTGIHLALGAAMRGPIIHPDELGYLDNARYFAHGGFRPDTEYYPGYSLLLVPVWLVAHDPLTIYRAALAVNAVLSGLGGWVTWLVVGRVAPSVNPRARIAVAAIVSLYPPGLLYSNLAMAECLVITLFGLVVLATALAVRTRRARAWCLLGTLAGLLTLAHPRGLAVVLAVALLAGLLLRPIRAHARAWAGLAVGLGASLALTRVLVGATRGPLANGFPAYSPNGILHKSLSLHGAASLVWELGGQFFYLSVATVGLLPLGLYLAGRDTARVVRGERSVAVIVRSFLGVSFVGVWVLSSLFMNLGERVDKLVYGRYNDAIALPLVALAVAEVLDPERSRRFARRSAAARRWLACGIGGTAASGSLLALGHHSGELRGDLNPVNVLGIYPLVRHLGRGIDVGALTAFVVAAVVVLALASWRSAAITALLTVSLFVVSAADAQAGYLVPGSRDRSTQDVMAQAIIAIHRQLGVRTPCIAYDQSAAVPYNYFATRFLVPGQRFQWFDASTAQTPCDAQLVVSGRTDLDSIPGYERARRITMENGIPQSLWVLPGPLATLLEAGGWLLPAKTPGPLPVTAMHALIRISPNRITENRRHPLRITVQALHDQGGAPWPGLAGLGTGSDAVRLAVRWYPADEAGALLAAGAQGGDAPVPVSSSNIELPRTTLPGQTATFRVKMSPGSNGTPQLLPGRYVVHFGLYQELVGSFSDQGALAQVVLTG